MRLKPESFSFTIILGLFSGLPALSIDLSAPTLVLLPQALGTTATVAGLSLSLFMLGFASGQFIGGRSSDRVGRRPVLLAALGVYTIGGFCCALATTGTGLAMARLLQGAAAGGCSVQPAAIIQDLFEGEAARRKQSYVTGVFAILPMLAPALGAGMVTLWGWRSVHSALAVAGLVLVAVVLALVSESRSSAMSGRRNGPLPTRITPLIDGDFARLCMVNALSYGALFAYIAGGPVVVMGILQRPAWVYAALFASTAIALSAGSWGSALFGRRRVGACAMIRPALIALATSTTVLAIVWAALPTAGFALFPLLMIITCVSRGVISPNLVYVGISSRRQDAGLASALLGLTQLLVGALASAVVAALLPRLGVSGLTVPMAVLGCSAALLWLPRARRFEQLESDLPA